MGVQKWIAVAASGVALLTAVFALYKSVSFDQRIAEMEVAQKSMDLFNAKDAILGFGLGEATVVQVDASASPIVGKDKVLAPERALLVTVPVTVKNLSKLPIAIDFNEQWAFLGRMLTAGAGNYAEVLNGSNDAYPIGWTRTQCSLGVSPNAWRNLGLDRVLVAKQAADAIRSRGLLYWHDDSLLLNPSESALEKHVGPFISQSREAWIQRNYLLKTLAAKQPYFDHTDIGRPCALLNGGTLVTTLRSGEEKMLKATYLVRGKKQWFSHLIRLHYRQTESPAETNIWCAAHGWNPIPRVAKALGWSGCAPLGDTTEPSGYLFQDLRQTLFLSPTSKLGHALDAKR